MRAVVVPVLAVLVMLTGCNPCDYTADTWNGGKKSAELPSDPVERYALQQRKMAEAGTGANLSPEHQAAREAFRRKVLDEYARKAKEHQAKIAAGYDPAKDRSLRYRKPTDQECAAYYGGQAMIYGIGTLIALFAMHVVTKIFTRFGLLDWLTGRADRAGRR